MLLLPTYACGKLEFRKDHSPFFFGTANRRALCHPPASRSSFRSCPLLQTTLCCMAGGDMAGRTIVVRYCRGRHLRSLHTPFFPQVCIPSMSYIVSSIHSPSTRAPLQPVPQMTITMTVYNGVLKAVPKKSTLLPPTPFCLS